MGFFGSLIVCVLSEEGGKFVGETEVLRFPSPRYISWESGKIVDPEWVSKGVQSVHVKSGRTLERVHYRQETLVTPLEVGKLRKQKQFRFITSYANLEPGVHHLVLPKLYAPDVATLRRGSDYPHLKKVDDMIAMTWTFKDDFSTSFVFKEASEKEFLEFPVVGTPRKVLVGPGFKESFREGISSLKDEGETLFVKTAAELLKSSVLNDPHEQT